MTTKSQQAMIDAGPFAVEHVPQSYLLAFFGTKKLADRFLAEFAEARDYAIREERAGRRAMDSTFEEQFWDGQLFLDWADMDERGIRRATLGDFVRDAHVYDVGMECDITLLRNGRERIIVVDWAWKEDEYALDAWLAKKP